ncbi:MAG: hypothetical protein ACTHMM_11935 [Agriterribacter sp.]
MEQTITIEITGDDAKTLLSILGTHTTGEDISEDIDELFEKALWAMGSDGVQSDGTDFKEYHYRFAHVRYAKKVLAIVSAAVEKHQNNS